MADWQVRAGGKYALGVGRTLCTVTVGSKPIPILLARGVKAGLFSVARRDTNTRILVLRDDLEPEVASHGHKG